MSTAAKGRLPAFFAVMFVFNMAANFAHPVTPSIIQTLGLSDYMFGLALASQMFVNFLFSPFWGRLNDYLSSKRTLLICGLGYALGQVFFALARTELQFVLARMFAGVFVGGAYVSFLTYVVNVSDLRSRGRGMAITATVQSVSSSFGYFVGGMLGEVNIFLSVWAQAATLAVCAVAFFLIMADDTRESLANLNAGALVKQCNPMSAFWQCRRFMTKMMAVLFLMYGLSSLGYIAFDQCFNYYIRDQFGLSSGYNGVIKAMLGVISLVANSTICMWILRKNETSRYMVGVMLICTVSMIGVILLESLVPFIIVNVLFLAFYFISTPLSQSMVAELGEGSDSNLVMGASNAVKSLGNIFGSLFAGFIYEINAKLPFVFGFIAFAAASALMVLYWQMERRQKTAAQG